MNSDIVMEFMSECLKVGGVYCKIPKVMMFDWYRKWCEEKSYEFLIDRTQFDKIIRREKLKGSEGAYARDSTNDGPRWQGSWVGVKYEYGGIVFTGDEDAVPTDFSIALDEEVEYAGAYKKLRTIESLKKDSAYVFIHEYLKNSKNAASISRMWLYSKYGLWCFAQEIIEIDSLRKFNRIITAITQAKRVQFGRGRIRGWLGLAEKVGKSLGKIKRSSEDLEVSGEQRIEIDPEAIENMQANMDATITEETQKQIDLGKNIRKREYE